MFSFKRFLQQHEDTVKSNNKKNNYKNQIIKITIAKTYTHRKKDNTKKGR